jgi:acetyl esterase/lipase
MKKSNHNYLLFGIIIVLVSLSNNGFAENPKPDEVINLWPTQPGITVEVFLPKTTNTGTGIIICPGGAYYGLMKTYEGYDVANWLNSIGIAAFVLTYHVTAGEPNLVLYPLPIKDGRKAVSFVRSQAAKYNLKQNQIGIMGFSAGGHLASSIGTHWQKPDADDIVANASCRPDFMILIYPVITFQKQYTHMGSRENLIGRDANDARVNEFSNELQVDANTPQAFIVHATDDKVVPVENALMFYSALKKAGVNSEMHIFRSGGHGFGMGFLKGQHCDWRPDCVQWFKNIKVVE